MGGVARRVGRAGSAVWVGEAMVSPGKESTVRMRAHPGGVTGMGVA